MTVEYRNQKFIDDVESIAERICAEKRSNHHRDKFFPRLIEEMGLKRGAEIGVDKGEFSHHILEKTSVETLYCIDPWMDNFGSDHRPGYYDPNGNVRMEQASAALKQFIQSGRANLIKATGGEASCQFEDGSLDFAYIDGDHSLEGIFTDIYSWTPKIRTGGIVAGHDYKDGRGSGIEDYWGNQLPYAVKTVVDYFCARYGFKVHPVGGRILSWWFVKA